MRKLYAWRATQKMPPSRIRSRMYGLIKSHFPKNKEKFIKYLSTGIGFATTEIDYAWNLIMEEVEKDKAAVVADAANEDQESSSESKPLDLEKVLNDILAVIDTFF